MSSISQDVRRRPLMCWSSRWEEFLTNHHQWWERVSSQEAVVYAMTPCLIEALAESAESRRDRQTSSKPRRGPGSFLSPADAEAERSFIRVCSTQTEIVGIRADGAPVRYPLWTDFVGNRPCRVCKREATASKATSIVDSDSSVHNHKAAPASFMATLRDQHESRDVVVRRAQLRYAGWLLQQPDFQRGVSCLRARWEAVAQFLPPDMINGRLFSLPGIVDHVDNLACGNQHVREFLVVLSRFAARWCLLGFASWDLPIPYRPLTGLPTDVIYGLRGPSALVSHYPVYAGTGDLRRCFDDQRLEAEMLGFLNNVPQKTLTNRSLNSEDESVIRMFILETAVRQRLPAKPFGLATRIDDAYFGHFGITRNSVKRLRRRYGRVCWPNQS